MSQKIPINEATLAQLREFASTTLGLDIHPNAKHETVLARVQAAWNQDEITLPEEPPETGQAGASPQPVTDAQKPPAEDKVRVILAVTEEPGGEEPVPVGVNGRVMLIPRGKEVEIPRAYFDVLTQAITYRYMPQVDERGNDAGLDPTPRKVYLYPFQRVA